MRIEQSRPGILEGTFGCERRTNTIEQTFICSDTYATVEDFFAGENVGIAIAQNGISDPASIENEYISTVSTGSGLPSQANKGSNSSSDIVTVFGSTATSPKSKNYYRL